MKRSELAEHIAGRIRRVGTLGFDEFMEAALYDPRLGYYTRGRKVTGRQGDFLTSVSAGRCFGTLLAEQFAEVWQRMGSPKRFSVVEQGANDGRLADDILEAVQARGGDLASAVRFVIVEPCESLRRRQESLLADRWTKVVTWVESLRMIRGLRGVFFCNELVDALPFKRVRFEPENGGWRELRVGLDERSRFCWRSAPLSSGDDILIREVRLLGENFSPGYTTEICLAAIDWAQALGESLDAGAAFIMDYGYTHEGYYAPDRDRGTLQCYRSHRADDDPFEAIGDKDITAHVNFTRLAQAGLQAGLELGGFTDQHRFLVGAGGDYLRRLEGKADTGFALQFQTLTHPGIMGRVFKALALVRGMDPAEAPLSGFRRREDLGL